MMESNAEPRRFGDAKLRITLAARENVEILAVSGYVDLQTIDDLVRALDVAVESDPRVLIADLTNVTYIGAKGVSLLFDEASRRLGGEQRLRVVANPTLKRLMAMLYSSADVPTLYDNVQDALGAGADVRRTH